jgi:hypothetical protein
MALEFLWSDDTLYKRKHHFWKLYERIAYERWLILHSVPDALQKKFLFKKFLFIFFYSLWIDVWRFSIEGALKQDDLQQVE